MRNRGVGLATTAAVELLLATSADLVEHRQAEPHHVERVRDDHGVVQAVGRGLEPREQIARDHACCGGVGVQQPLGGRLSRPSAVATTRPVSRQINAVRYWRRRRVSRPVVMTVSSIPTRDGDRSATAAAAALTARMTVFQPTPKRRATVDTAVLSATVATAARVAGRVQTAPGSTDGER